MPELPSAAVVGPPHIVVIAAHPAMEQSRVNHALLQAVRALAGDGVAVEVRDLYALYPDYLIDVAAEQACLAAASLIVWQHPLHWYGMTPLMKLWVDEVLTFGWAYGPGGTALAGKPLWLVTSTGGTRDSYHPDSYNRYAFTAFVPPYEQTAALCGMRFIEPLVLHGAHHASADAVAAHAETYCQRLRRHPAWPQDDAAGDGDCADCAVPATARPAATREAHRAE